MKNLFRSLAVCAMLSAFPLLPAHAEPMPAAAQGLKSPVTVAANIPRKWTQVPGKASEIAIGGDQVWALGVDTVPGGHSIFRYNGKGWDKIPGGASAIAVDSDGVPWVCQDNYDVYQRLGNEWSKVPGKAFQVAIGGEQVYVLGTDHTEGGYGIYRWARGAWEKLPGAGVTIAADSDGVPWVCNESNDIYRRVQNSWEKMPGKATQIAIGEETVWAIGADQVAGGSGVYRWARGIWERNDGGAKRVAVGRKHLWVVNDKGNIYRSDL